MALRGARAELYHNTRMCFHYHLPGCDIMNYIANNHTALRHVTTDHFARYESDDFGAIWSRIDLTPRKLSILAFWRHLRSLRQQMRDDTPMLKSFAHPPRELSSPYGNPHHELRAAHSIKRVWFVVIGLQIQGMRQPWMRLYSGPIIHNPYSTMHR